MLKRTTERIHTPTELARLGSRANSGRMSPTTAHKKTPRERNTRRVAMAVTVGPSLGAYQPGFPFCPPQMDPLYIRKPQRPGESSSSHNRPGSEAVTQPALPCSGLEARASRAFLGHRSSRVSLLCQAGVLALATSICRDRERRDPLEHRPEQAPSQVTLRQQQPVIARVFHQPATRLDKALLETGQRPGVDPLREHQPPPEIPEVVGQYAQLQAHLVGPKPVTREWLFSLLSLFIWVESTPFGESVEGRIVISLAIIGALLVWNLQNTRSRLARSHPSLIFH